MVGNPFVGAFEGIGPEILTFWAQMALATLVPISGPKKVSISGPIPSNTPRNGFPPIQIHTSSPIKQQVHWKLYGQETRDFKAHSDMVCNKKVRSLKGRIKGVEGWDGGELEGENKRGGVWGGVMGTGTGAL
jgi:hypothetical protein